MTQKLRDLLDVYKKGDGVGKLYTLAQIRNYVSKKSWRVLIDEINAINEIEELNILLGAGMRGALHTLIVTRKGQLTEW